MNKERFRTILSDIAILAICFFAGAGNYMNAAINSFQQAFPNISQSTIMLVSTLPCLIAVPVMLAAGRLVGRAVTYRQISIIGTVLIIAGGLLPFFITASWAFVLFCRAILGIGAGCYAVRNSYIIHTVPPEKLIPFTGYSTVALTIGGSAAGPIVGTLVEKSWNYAFLYNTVPVLILLFVVFGMKEPEKLPQPSLSGQGDRFGPGRLSWRIYFYALTQLLIIGTLYPMTVSGVSIFFDAYGLGSPAVAGALMSLFPLSGVIGNLFLNRIMKTFDRFTVSAMALLVILSAALCLLSRTLVAVSVSYALAGFGYHVIIGVLQVYNGLEAPPEKIAVGSTMILACKSIGIFLSSYFITLCTALFRLEGRIGVENAFLGCLIIYILLLVFSSVIDITPAESDLRHSDAECP